MRHRTLRASRGSRPRARTSDGGGATGLTHVGARRRCHILAHSLARAGWQIPTCCESRPLPPLLSLYAPNGEGYRVGLERLPIKVAADCMGFSVLLETHLFKRR